MRPTRRITPPSTPNAEPRVHRPTLVTGASGFAGGHLTRRLRAAGAQVIGWHRPDLPPHPGGDVSWQGVDLLQATAVRAAVHAAQPARIYHLAGYANVARAWQEPREALEVNLLGTHHLLEAVRAMTPGQRPRVLVIGSGTVYRASDEALQETSALGPAGPYPVSKLAQELLVLDAVRTDGLDAVVARSFNHIGPGQTPDYVTASVARQIARIEAGLEPPVLAVGNLEARRDLTDVRDTVAAYEALMARGTSGRVYNVCSGRALVVRMLVEALVGRARVAVRVEHDPSRMRPSDTPVILGSHDVLTADTGWTPSIPLEQTLDDTLAWWRARVAADRSA